MNYWLILFLVLCGGQQPFMKAAKYNPLTPEEERIIVYKGTEMPFTGKYLKNKESGIYACKRCSAELFRSKDKFDSHCGWPSFDDAIPGAVKEQLDADGRRTEILCARCGAHLGHVFFGEGFTAKDIRHCVNSLSLSFEPATESKQKETKMVTDTAYFSSGCFWGSEYYLAQPKGIVSTTVGYMGGTKDNPTYEEVCTGQTGYAETVEVVFDSSIVSYEELVKFFFETHDFTQINRQGPDIGPQYRSVIFYTSDEQRKIAETYKHRLEEMGYNVATQIAPAPQFWTAEGYHQDYYAKKGGRPYCHKYTKIF